MSILDSFSTTEVSPPSKGIVKIKDMDQIGLPETSEVYTFQIRKDFQHQFTSTFRVQHEIFCLKGLFYQIYIESFKSCRFESLITEFGV